LNKFPILFSASDLVLFFEVEITSKALSIPVISSDRQDRLELIQQLHEEGTTDAEIAEYMNERNLKTPTGKQYYSELVWVTRKKFLKRNLRKLDFTYKLKKLMFRVNA
jgi:hypothetical protein